MTADGFESLLAELFGYQRFEEEPGLEKLIMDTAGRLYPWQLGYEELVFVTGAGDTGAGPEPPRLPEGLEDD